MAIRLGDIAPDFTADTTQGTISFHEWLGDSWAILFSHPKDFTPVCTTELGYLAKLAPEFKKRGVKIIGLSVDPVDSHSKWAADIEETQGAKLNFPVIADSDHKVSDLHDMIHPNANDTMTVRSVFIIGADKKVKLIITYPASTGRNFDEILRVIDSLQLTAKYSVATPVNWKDGEDVIIAGAVSDEDDDLGIGGCHLRARVSPCPLPRRRRRRRRCRGRSDGRIDVDRNGVRVPLHPARSRRQTNGCLHRRCDGTHRRRQTPRQRFWSAVLQSL